MSKFRVAFDLDLTDIAPEIATEQQDMKATVEGVVTSMLLSQARTKAREELHQVRKDPSLDNEVRTIKMGEQLRKIMLTLMAEANLNIEPLPAHTTIQRELPFERNYSCAA